MRTYFMGAPCQTRREAIWNFALRLHSSVNWSGWILNSFPPPHCSDVAAAVLPDREPHGPPRHGLRLHADLHGGVPHSVRWRLPQGELPRAPRTLQQGGSKGLKKVLRNLKMVILILGEKDFPNVLHILPHIFALLAQPHHTDHVALPQARLHLRHPRRAVRHAARRAAHRPRQHTSFSQVTN